MKKYLGYAKATGKEVGIHAHNNQQLAFANTIEAIIHGANRVDATMAGLGRGAGNCPMELLIGFLRNPEVQDPADLPGVAGAICCRWAGKVEWGPCVQYNITGQLNQHPRIAIAARAGSEPRQVRRFLRQADHRRVRPVRGAEFMPPERTKGRSMTR